MYLAAPVISIRVQRFVELLTIHDMVADHVEVILPFARGTQAVGLTCMPEKVMEQYVCGFPPATSIAETLNVMVLVVLVPIVPVKQSLEPTILVMIGKIVTPLLNSNPEGD